MAEKKGQNYLHGAAILAMGVVIMKILGFIYKVPIGNIIGVLIKDYSSMWKLFRIVSGVLSFS